MILRVISFITVGSLILPVAFANPIQRSGPAPLPWESTPGEALQLSEVLASVEKRMPLTLAAKAQLETAQGREVSARGVFDLRLQSQFGGLSESYNQRTWDAQLTQQFWGTPLEVYAGWRRGQGEFRPYEGKSLTGTEGEYRTGFKLPLLRDFLTDPGRTRKDVAEAGSRAAEGDFRFRTLDLKRIASERYWDWVGSSLQLNAVIRLYRLAEERMKQVERRVHAGSAAKIEEVEAERMITQRLSQLIEAERNYQRAALELSLYLRDENGNSVVPGRPLSEVLPISTPPQAPKDLDVWIKDAQAQRGDLRSLSEQQEGLEREASLASVQRLPRLDVQFEYAADRGVPKAGETEVRGSVGLSFPIQNREARGNFLAQQARLDQLKQNRRFLQDQVAQEVQTTFSALLAAHQKAKAMAKDQELSERLANAERKRFQDGLSSLLIVNLREQAANDSVLKALEARIDYEKLRIRLSVVRGSDL
ncbi:MAG: TolC family protein [Bdellovibrionales bacterium]|nr:TolC family protein [Bdellovibrionales bacterium]